MTANGGHEGMGAAIIAGVDAAWGCRTCSRSCAAAAWGWGMDAFRLSLDGCSPRSLGRSERYEISLRRRRASCAAKFLVNLGPIYFMGEGRKPSAPAVRRPP